MRKLSAILGLFAGKAYSCFVTCRYDREDERAGSPFAGWVAYKRFLATDSRPFLELRDDRLSLVWDRRWYHIETLDVYTRIGKRDGLLMELVVSSSTAYDAPTIINQHRKAAPTRKSRSALRVS